MKVLVVDDEPLAQQRLQQLLKQIDLVTDVELANNGEQAIQQCEKNSPDVVLLDIRMPGIDGLETAQHLSQLDKVPAIIFTTAYDEYALEAFKVHAVDYLLKPVRAEKLESSLLRANQLNQVQMMAIKAQPQQRKNITAKISGNIKLIPINDIYFFRADQKYVTVKYTQGETIIEDTLKDLQHEFEDKFARVHRNALVARKYITGIQKNADGHTYVTIQGCDELVEISRRHLSAIKKLVMSL
ncbi:LytR/AlgR family response regulator transcription factor [Aliikangiella maris]|uniref:LytTR family DNA-binding domain-containing protein n=2 Tax=Aliikangiella maris TaxID=3162458 RepID=A0ABV3MN53_9GAMM